MVNTKPPAKSLWFLRELMPPQIHSLCRDAPMPCSTGKCGNGPGELVEPTTIRLEVRSRIKTSGIFSARTESSCRVIPERNDLKQLRGEVRMRQYIYTIVGSVMPRSLRVDVIPRFKQKTNSQQVAETWSNIMKVSSAASRKSSS